MNSQSHRIYRTPSYPPQEPEPMIPFQTRHPRLTVYGRNVLYTAVGTCPFLLLWAAGWGIHRLGYLTDEPTLAASVLILIALMMAATILFGLRLIGKCMWSLWDK